MYLFVCVWFFLFMLLSKCVVFVKCVIVLSYDVMARSAMASTVGCCVRITSWTS